MKAHRSAHTWPAVFLYALFLAVPAVPFSSAAGDREPGGPGEGFSHNIRALVSAEVQDPAHSTQNPDNAFLLLPRYTAQLELRPDLLYDAEYVNVMFKPRFTSEHQWWRDGVPAGETDAHTRVFVNEWRVQAKPHDSFFLSFGKEKLLWGPSFLASPSNILFKDTEKLDPKTEVEGAYLARAMYLPTPALSLIAISETQDDATTAQAKEDPVRALKTDWVGAAASVSLIGYFQQDARFRLGSYGQWTASDALLLYYDGIVSRGTDALYPVPDPASPLVGSFARTQDSSSRIYATVTAGGSYTFLSGSTLSLEFLYNGQGYGEADADAYYRLRRSASDHYFDGGRLSALSRQLLGETMNTGQPFLRRYYAMGQFQAREIVNVLDIIVRYIHSLEERAGLASSIVEWQLSDRVELFNINSVAVSRGGETEFNAILAWSVLAGLELSW
jgi:hypothetical protein